MMQSHHSSQVREAIMTLRVNGFPYEKIAKSINNAGLGPISKDTVCYNVKKYEETNSVVNRPKTGRPCNKRTPQMIKNTRKDLEVSEEIWPPCSLNLNVIDFAIWEILAQKACSKLHKNIDSLKPALQIAWEDLDQEMISASCWHACKRMEANGGYIIDR